MRTPLLRVGRDAEPTSYGELIGGAALNAVEVVPGGEVFTEALQA